MDPSKVEQAVVSACETNLTSAGSRQRAAYTRTSWRVWLARWAEVQAEPPELRALLVCLSCERFCDGQGNWLAMPPGLPEMLWRGPTNGVLHGVCPPCLQRMLGDPTREALAGRADRRRTSRGVSPAAGRP